MKSEMDKKVFVASILIAFVFLVLGFLFFITFEQEKQTDYELRALEYYLESEKSNLLILYSQVEDTPYFCNVLDSIIDVQSQKFMELKREVEEYSKKNILTEENPIKERLILSNLKLYLILKSQQDRCGTILNIPLIYVYDEIQECPYECDEVVNVLEELKLRNNLIRIFAFPKKSNNEILDLIYLKHNINKAPSLILPNSQVITGVISIEELENKLKINDNYENQ